LFPDILYNQVAMYVWYMQAGWSWMELAVVLTGPGVDIDRIKGFDGQGRPAVAYVGTDGSIHYRIDDGAGWQDIVLPRGLDPVSGLAVDPLSGSDAALAFDRFDNPVIAYGGTAGIMLAYDPVVVPEPASLLMLCAGLALLRPRRR